MHYPIAYYYYYHESVALPQAQSVAIAQSRSFTMPGIISNHNTAIIDPSPHIHIANRNAHV